MQATPLYRDTLEAVRNASAAEAYELAQALCHEQPNEYEAEQIAGIAALSSAQHQLALRHFSTALQLTDDPALSAASWTGIGRVHLDLDLPSEANGAFRRALSLAPEFPPALVGLAEALNYLLRYREAEAAAARAIELGVANSRSYAALASARLFQKKYGDAEIDFRRALELDPHSVQALYGLGSLARTHGRMDEAERLFRDIAARDAAGNPGLEQIVSLKRFTDPDDPDLQTMQRLEADTEAPVSPSARAGLAFALAKAYDDLNDAESASRYLIKANRYERESQFKDYRPEAEEERVERIRQLFTREFVNRVTVNGPAELHPIFIMSLPRSGSTLTEQMIASHSRIAPGGELGHLSRIATALSLKWGANPNFPDIDVDEARRDLEQSGRDYAHETARIHLVHPYFTDKSLENFLYVGLIKMMLPQAKIIYVRRHPLATALGVFRRRFTRGIPYSSDLEHISRYLRSHYKLIQHWREAAPEGLTEVFYEALVSDPERELRRIFAHLDLEFEPATLEYYKLERPVATASVVQVRQPLEQAGVNRHEHYGKLLEPVAEALQNEIAAYEREMQTHLDHAST